MTKRLHHLPQIASELSIFGTARCLFGKPRSLIGIACNGVPQKPHGHWTAAYQ